MRKNRLRALLRKPYIGGPLAVFAAVLVLSWASLGGSERQVVDAWGEEALQASGGALLDHIVRPANACGMGASSCFKCHNGKRAAKPNDNPEEAPWHIQHTKVNNSCVGCHNGNPRLMREKMAHQNLLANPRSDARQACATCHSGDDVEALLKIYESVGK